MRLLKMRLLHLRYFLHDGFRYLADGIARATSQGILGQCAD